MANCSFSTEPNTTAAIVGYLECRTYVAACVRLSPITSLNQSPTNDEQVNSHTDRATTRHGKLMKLLETVSIQTDVAMFKPRTGQMRTQ